MNLIQNLVAFILFGMLILSYYIFLQTDEKYDNYLNHPFWFGMDKRIVMLFLLFQILGVLGFLISIGSWIFNPPQNGSLKEDKLFYALSLFFISSIIWPIATRYNVYLLSVTSIILTALASIWLLIGSIEDKDNNLKTFRIISLFFLCIVTVIGDGVIWNTNYILKNKEKI